jgi:26S proteasome regulatory subunit N3
VFRADGTHNLITRLHHNVIRTGLRRINLAYSRISLKDVATKLHMASAADAECIIAKAIRDGGIDAVIDHEGAAPRGSATTTPPRNQRVHHAPRMPAYIIGA